MSEADFIVTLRAVLQAHVCWVLSLGTAAEPELRRVMHEVVNDMSGPAVGRKLTEAECDLVVKLTLTADERRRLDDGRKAT